MLTALFQGIGIGLIIAVIISFLGIIIFQITSGKSLKRYGAGTDAWAVVTGSSDGIGKAYAKQLADKQFNIVLLSRTESKLTEVAKDIESTYHVQTKVLAIDFSKATSADYEKIRTLLTPLNIGVLVNNVALSHDMPERFLETDQTRMRDIINVNICATNELTYIVLPLMVANQKRTYY